MPSPLSAEDRSFDQVYPDAIRRLSRLHWSPVEVSRCAARLLCTDRPAGVRPRILDVGSGVGKFCLVGAGVTEGRFVGVERRKNLVEVAREAAQKLGSPAEFLHGDALELDWAGYDGVYLYNPFEELLFPEDGYIDRTVEFGQPAFNAFVLRTEDKLRTLPVRARLALFHGTGGDVPCGFRLLEQAGFATGTLELWERTLPPGPCDDTDCLDCGP